VELAEAMIAAEVEQYQRRLQAFNVVPEIVHLQRSLEEIRQAEHRRLQSQLQSLSPEQAAAVEMLARSLVNKLLHHALQAIKIAAKEGNTAAVDAIRQAFGLHLTGRYGVREHPFAHPASAARVQETETEESRTANTITLKGHTAQ
jgi:glutamyl-tRNA reductase